jgi:small multidrug resistance family-3 protein
MELPKTLDLFVVTALAEILGCDPPYRCLQHGKPAWVLVPPAISLGLFTWLLSLHPTASGRVDTVYGGGFS